MHTHVAFSYAAARATRGALDVFTERVGVCRDFQHLAITFCRCLNIPARYAAGYLGDIGVPVAPYPMDFSAWFEVYLGGRWWACDARHNTRRAGRVLMATGLDATDAAITTTFGAATLTHFEVISEQVPDRHVAGRSVHARARRPSRPDRSRGGCVTAASRRAASASNPGRGPVQRSESTSLKSGTSSRKRRQRPEQERLLALGGEVARETSGVGRIRRPRAVIGGNRLEVFVPREHGGGRLRAPAADARIAVGAVTDQRQVVRNRGRRDAELRPTPSSSSVTRVRRCTCTTRVPRTHCDRSLSGVQISTRSTRGSAAARCAADASASSASTSTIGHTTKPAAASTSSSSGNCAHRSGGNPGARLVAGPQVVAKGFDDVIGGHADVRRALADHREQRMQHAAHRRDLAAVGVARRRHRVVVAKQFVGAVDEMDVH